jgi:hypothetical protein
MDIRALASAVKKQASDTKSTLSSAPPRIQLFFLATFLKVGASIAVGLASFLRFQPLESAAGLVLFVWFGLMLFIAAPQADGWLIPLQRWLRPAWRISAISLAVILAVEGTAVGSVLVWNVIDRGSMPAAARAISDAFTTSDATALSEQATQNLLEGKNPYAYANIITALGASPEAYNKLTPLRAGAFADSFPYPGEEELKTVWQQAITQPDVIPPEIESKFNYPAGSFLLPAPFMALGISDMRLMYLFFTIPALAYAVKVIGRRWRWYLLLGVALSIELWNAIFAGDNSLLYLPFIMMGWLLLRRKLWLSALFMGIAAATKQTAWFFLPFYLILAWRVLGLKRATLALFIIGAVFLAANAPFIVADPGLWLSSVLAPMTDNMFPMGAGVITLVTSGTIKLSSSLPFAIMEIAVLAAGLLWYLRYAPRYPHTGLFLAVLPLYFAWRSPWDYFYFADLILLAAILLYYRHNKHEEWQAPPGQQAAAA